MQRTFIVKDDVPTNVIPINANYKDCVLTNTGVATIYLGNDTTITVDNAYPLDPGSTKIWYADDPLWAITNTNETGYLNVVDNAGEPFPSGLFAGELLRQIAQYELVEQDLSNVNFLLTDAILTEGYNSLNLSVTVASELEYYEVVVAWYNTPSSTQLYWDSYYVSGCNAAIDVPATIRLPIKGKYVRIQINPVAGAAAGFSYSMLLSIRNLNASEDCLLPGRFAAATAGSTYGDDGSFNVCGWETTLTSTAGATPIQYWYPPTSVGKCKLTIRFANTTAASVTTYIGDRYEVNPLYYAGDMVTNRDQDVIGYEFYAPRRPVFVYMRNHSATVAVDLDACIAWEPRR